MKNRDFGYELFRVILTVSLAILLFMGVGYAGDRRNIETYDTGKIDNYGNSIVKHYTLLDPGECNFIGCVMYEHTTQGGLLYQWYDHDDDNVCDRIVVWKTLVDPTWGTYYKLFSSKTCGGSI